MQDHSIKNSGVNLKKGETYNLYFEVTESVYSGFKDTFKDNNPLHTDAVFAGKKGFKGEVMYGNILGGFLSYFIGEGLPMRDVIIHSQDIKYLAPFYLNDKLELKAVVVDVFESVNVVEIKYVFENQDKQKIAKGNINIGLI